MSFVGPECVHVYQAMPHGACVRAYACVQRRNVWDAGMMAYACSQTYQAVHHIMLTKRYGM